MGGQCNLITVFTVATCMHAMGCIHQSIARFPIVLFGSMYVLAWICIVNTSVLGIYKVGEKPGYETMQNKLRSMRSNRL